ncbi:MAG: aldo/keto reductase [Rhodospirillales bacterium]|nr:aldo/keto reductase [Rhodospirillales bacterium]
MRYRKLGNTGIDISVIGFGAWGIGGHVPGGRSYGETDNAVSRQAIERALEAGITFFDTAPLYGEGHSEALLGKALSSCRDKVVIATKVGYTRFDAPPEYSPSSIRASVEASLRRLRTDYIDILQFHDVTPEYLEAHPETLGVAQTLKQEGKVRVLGASVKVPEHGIPMIERFGMEAIQTNLNMMDIRAVDCGLLEIAADNGASIIARTPLAFGFLSGFCGEETGFSETDHRSRWPADQIQAWRQGATLVLGAADDDGEGTAAQKALRFTLSLPAVASTIPGMMKPEEVDENAAVAALGALSHEAVEKVLDLNHTNTFFG